MPNQNFAFFIFSLALSLAVSGCDDPQTYRDAVSKQNDSFTQAKMEELKPAEATYKGTVHLNESGQDFDCVLEVKRIRDTTRISQSQDQTETVEVPKLGGSMRFPSLESVDVTELSSYSALTTPMGGYLKVIFDFGNFNPRTQSMILPYTVPGYSQNSLGQLDGTLVNGHFTGTWFSKPFGIVGTFDFSQSVVSSQPISQSNGDSESEK